MLAFGGILLAVGMHAEDDMLAAGGILTTDDAHADDAHAEHNILVDHIVLADDSVLAAGGVLLAVCTHVEDIKLVEDGVLVAASQAEKGNGVVQERQRRCPGVREVWRSCWTSMHSRRTVIHACSWRAREVWRD